MAENFYPATDWQEVSAVSRLRARVNEGLYSVLRPVPCDFDLEAYQSNGELPAFKPSNAKKRRRPGKADGA